MFRSYLRVALRNMWKNRMHTIFNVLGLSMGVGICITVFLMVYSFLHMDEFHKDADRIYMVGHTKELKSGVEKWGLTPGALGPSIAADFPEVEEVVRVDNFNATVRYGDKLFDELIYFVEPEFLDMFTFPLEAGSVTDFNNPSSVILSHETAVKYFGEESAIGKVITMRFDETHRFEMTVAGVFQKFPRTSSFDFPFLAPFDAVRQITDKAEAWDYTVAATFVKLRLPSQAPDFENKLQRYVKTFNAIQPDRPIKSFYLENLLTLSGNSQQIRGDMSGGMNPHGARALAIIAGLVMLMACFNFMNNMIGASSRRFKEVGIRKVVGGRRAQLLQQFLGESLIISFVSLAFGYVLAEAVFNPFMATIVERFSFEMNLAKDWPLVAFLLILTTSAGIISGLYPSLVLSAFQPVKIFRDLARVGGNRWLTRTLIVLQFSICLFAIVAAIVFKQNNDFLSKIDLGFRGNQVAVLYFETASEWQTFRNAIDKHPGIINVAGSVHQVGRDQSVGINIESEGNPFQANVLRIGSGYFEMMDMKIGEGRSFDENLKSDIDESVMVNRLLADQMGWENPIGKRLRFEGSEFTVIGVAENFYTRSIMRPVDATVIKNVREDDFRFMSIKIRADMLDDVMAELKSQWAVVRPYQPFVTRFQDEVFQEDFRENENIKDMFLYVASMTMIIAGTGLFALVSVNIARRTKEIGIRKVLGASAVQIMQLVNREFYALIVVASVLIFPIAYLALNGLLNSVFPTHAEISIWPFVGASVAMLVLAVVTIGSRVVKVAVSNPVDSLRYE